MLNKNSNHLDTRHGLFFLEALNKTVSKEVADCLKIMNTEMEKMLVAKDPFVSTQSYMGQNGVLYQFIEKFHRATYICSLYKCYLDFIDYMECDIDVKDISMPNKVVGFGTISASMPHDSPPHVAAVSEDDSSVVSPSHVKM